MSAMKGNEREISIAKRLYSSHMLQMLQCLQKAHRCSTLTQNWEKDVKTCNDVLEQSVHLAKGERFLFLILVNNY